jgi:nicotinamide riboside kinase
MLKRIAVTGPESTGKSILSEQMAMHYKTVWVPEYAREYLHLLGRPYEEKDLLAIATGQLSMENRLAGNATDWLICDTELTVIKIWSEVRYGRCDNSILEKLENHHYDYYLLCDVDLPWEYDPLREHPEMRQYLFDKYRTDLNSRKLPYSVISGHGHHRLANAIAALAGINF